MTKLKNAQLVCNSADEQENVHVRCCSNAAEKAAPIHSAFWRWVSVKDRVRLKFSVPCIKPQLIYVINSSSLGNISAKKETVTFSSDTY